MTGKSGKGPGGNRGVTLVELLVVLGIFGILLFALGASFQGWMEKYKVEDETKTLYANLMNARARAVQRNRIHFVSLTTTGYGTYEDTNTPPDGNGVLEDGTDTLIANVTAQYSLASSLGMPLQFRFSRDGLSSVSCWIRFASTINQPDYDCIAITPTRINTGVFDASTNTCQEK